MQNRKTVIITGCSSGIGHNVAHGLSARGYRVFATARNADDVKRLSAEGLESLQLDLDDSDSINNCVTEILAATDGEIYALFNNGGYGQTGAVEDLRRDVLRQQLETNLLGWHELTRLVIPAMRAQGEGRIIQNSSVLGLVTMPYRGAYTCAKFALEGLTDTLRLELHGSGIHVSLIEPGPIRSRFRKNALKKFLENIDYDNSAHSDEYQAMLGRLKKKGDAVPFTLPPEAVLKKVVHALESKRPQPRYYVTLPTYLFGFLRRLLSTSMLDRILRQASGDGKR